MTGKKRVTSVLRRIQAGTLREFLNHARNVDAGQPAKPDLSMPID